MADAEKHSSEPPVQSRERRQLLAALMATDHLVGRIDRYISILLLRIYQGHHDANKHSVSHPPQPVKNEPLQASATSPTPYTTSSPQRRGSPSKPVSVSSRVSSNRNSLHLPLLPPLLLLLRPSSPSPPSSPKPATPSASSASSRSGPGPPKPSKTHPKTDPCTS